MSKFDKGVSYYATACMGGRQFVVTVSGRIRERPVFIAGKPIAAERLMVMDGREFAYLRGEDGQTYTVSSEAKADVEGAVRLMEFMAPPWVRNFKRAARHFFCGNRGTGNEIAH